MSNQSSKIERFELRLRPNITVEAALIDQLDRQDGIYGGKTQLLRECLRRGFVALGDAVAAQPATASEEAVLNALASKFQASEYSYRVGKLFLDAKGAVEEGSPSAPVSEGMSTHAADSNRSVGVGLVADHEVQISPKALVASVPDAAASIPEEIVVASQSGQTGDSDGIPSSKPEQADVQEPEPPAKPPVNWSTFRNIAGSGDENSEKK